MKTTLAALLALLFAALPASAALGEYESSIDLDQRVLGGTARSEVHSSYKLHQITAAHGVSIREYVSAEGKVFAVAWQSPALPNLQQLLGAYFAPMQQAAQGRLRHSGPLVVKRSDVVIISAGRMGGFYGYAYVPGLAPAAFAVEQMR